MDGTSIVGRFSPQSGGGDFQRSVSQAGGRSVQCERGKRDPVAATSDAAGNAEASVAGLRSALGKIEARADLILDAYAATLDITLAELQVLLADHGTQVALGTIWRFFDRRGITRKRDGACDFSRTVPTS